MYLFECMSRNFLWLLESLHVSFETILIKQESDSKAASK